MIEIYPSKLEGAPIEEHSTSRRMTIGSWFKDNVNNYEPRDPSPISVHVNGEYVKPSDWESFKFSPSDTVAIYPEAKGDSFMKILTYGLGQKLFFPKQPKPKTQTQAPRGSPLESPSAKGNVVNLNSPIREVAGRRKVFPDYLLPLHRYFESPRKQVVETLLCVGKGDFDIPAGKVLIGDTPMISLGDDAEYQIYAPGASLGFDPRAKWWHSAPEVASTSTGSSGLELNVTTSAEPVARASSYIFSGFTVSIPTGAGSFPATWTNGLIVRIDVRYPYTITDGVGVGVRDTISGDIDQLDFTPGALIEITGDNAGSYIVETFDDTGGTMTLNYSDGSPAAGLTTGAKRMGIGYRGLRYRITAAGTNTLTLERLTDSGATDSVWGGFSDITVNDAVISLDQNNLEGGWAGPFAACPENEVTNKIEIDFFFPGGIIFIGDDGWIAPPFFNFGVNIIQVEAQYRDMSTAGAWTSVVRNFSDATQDQLGYTVSIDLPGTYRPEVRVRRIGAKSTNPSVQDLVQWYGLRAQLSAPASYSGVTTMAVKVRGGGRIGAQSEQQISAEVTRKLPVRAGGAWQSATVTRDIAPWIAYVAKSIGYTDDDIDLDELDALDAIWKARGDYYDNSIESSSTAKESFNAALRAGFAELTIERGKIRPVRDAIRTVFEQMYTPQNCTEPLTREFQAVTPDDFDGVDVEYTDERTWQVETVECRLPGDLGLRTEKLTLEGVTNRTRAWRIGMRQRREQKYRRYQLSTSTELDALNSRYLSYVAIADDVPGYGKSAILISHAPLAGGFLLESSEPFDWSAGGGHVVGIRRKDGTLSGPYAATRIDDYRLTIPALDFTPDTSWTVEPPHLLFGPLNRWVYPALISDVTPSGSSGASIKAVNYDDRVYSDDDNSPP